MAAIIGGIAKQFHPQLNTRWTGTARTADALWSLIREHDRTLRARS